MQRSAACSAWFAVCNNKQLLLNSAEDTYRIIVPLYHDAYRDIVVDTEPY